MSIVVYQIASQPGRCKPTALNKYMYAFQFNIHLVGSLYYINSQSAVSILN